MRFTSSYCVVVGGNLVSWKSKKQNVVSRSSALSEYRVMTQFVCEIIWLHQLLMEVDIGTSVPEKFWCDNQVALYIASIHVFHVSKMEAPIIKDGGSNYQRWRLQIWRLKIVNNLATNPPFFLPC